MCAFASAKHFCSVDHTVEVSLVQSVLLKLVRKICILSIDCAYPVSYYYMHTDVATNIKKVNQNLNVDVTFE